MAVGKYDPERLSVKKPLDIHVHTRREQHEHGHDAHEHHDHQHDHHHYDHSLIFETWSYRSDRPFSFQNLRDLMTKLLPAIFRVKGILFIQEYPDSRAILHVVGRRVCLVLDDEWHGRAPYSQFAVIGGAGEINTHELARSFDQCLAKKKFRPSISAFERVKTWLRQEAA